MSVLLKAARTPSVVLNCRCIHTTTSALAGGKFRKGIGLSPCGYQYGPMTDIPDWSFEDNTPAPLSMAAMHRMNKRRFIAESVEVLLNEVMIAKYQHAMGMHLRPHELTYHPRKIEASVERQEDVPILSATADDIPQPPNVPDKEEVGPILYTLQDGAKAANVQPHNRRAIFEVMTQDAIRKELEKA